MAYSALVQSSITIEDTSVGTVNLSNSIFIATHAYTQDRVTSFSTWEEVKDLIPSTDPLYTAFQVAFSQDNVPAPVYLGRRQLDSMTMTPSTISDSTAYTFSITVYNTSDYTDSVTTAVEADSGSDATAADIATEIYNQMSGISNLTLADNGGSVTVTAAADYDFYVSDLTSKITLSYSTTEDASDVFTACLDEGENDWYFVIADDHSEDFVLAMAAEIEATESDNYPKVYMVSVNDDSYSAAESDPAVTILGQLAEGGYDRTSGEWNQLADTKYPEFARAIYIGYYDAGSIGWKGLTNISQVTAVADPNSGVALSTTKQGYIKDRNASWYAPEFGTDFVHGGMMASGEWGDVIRGKDWINSEIITDMMDMWLDMAASGKLTFQTADLQKPLNVVDNVLEEAVDRKILRGYVGASLPSSISSSDQINRVLDSVSWTGYLAGAIYTMVVDGTLTYADEDLS